MVDFLFFSFMVCSIVLVETGVALNKADGRFSLLFLLLFIACSIGYVWVKVSSKKRKQLKKRKKGHKFLLIHSLNKADSLFESVIRVKKKDWLVLLVYYLITLPFFIDFISSNPHAFDESTSIFVILGMCILMWGIIFFSALMVIFGYSFFLFYLFVCVLHLIYFILPTEKKKYFKENFSQKWFYTNLARTNVFLWNLIISILSFSYLAKIFPFFKGGKGTFGGGGASGRW